jgi:hypothetical protein
LRDRHEVYTGIVCIERPAVASGDDALKFAQSM